MAEKAKNPHAGHRKRLREAYLRGGFEALSDVNRLELLLFYAFRQGDTNPLAHKLLEHFGSLSGVLDADIEQLMEVDGIGESSAVLIRLIGQLAAEAEKERVRNRTKGILSTTAQCAEYLMPYFFGLNRETVYVLCMDGKCKALACRQLGEGSVNAADVSIRRIVEIALHHNASSVILAHNHPCGICDPSDEDSATTLRVWQALDAVGIQFADHIIISGTEYHSMAESGFFESFL